MRRRSCGRRSWVGAICVSLALSGLGASRAFAHGGQFLGPPYHPVKLDPRSPRQPTDPIKGWWDANVDSLANQDAVGPVVTDGVADADLHRRKARGGKILPFLRDVLQGKHGGGQDLIAAATIALAKCSDDPGDVDWLLRFSDNPKNPGMTLEAAAISPGLFRRSYPKNRFDPGVYDRIRARCLAVYDGQVHSAARARCLAILAIGLLGDQPTSAGANADAAWDLSRELWSRFRATKDDESQVALVVALGLQSAVAVAPDVLEGLRHLASTGESRPNGCSTLVRAHAVLALARVASADASGILLRLVRAPDTDDAIRDAAIVGLSLAAPTLFPAARAAAASEVANHVERGNAITVGVALRALGRVFAAAMSDPADAATLRDPSTTLLLAQIDGSNFDARSYAALSTGFALRPALDLTIDPDDIRAVFRRKAIAALMAIDADRTPPDLRGIALLALGLSRNRAALPRLIVLAGRRDVDAELRARAVTALGLLGDRSSGALDVLRAGVAPNTPDLVRREAARALGFLGDIAGMAPLLTELATELSDTVNCRAAVALGALRRIEAIDPLIALASDRRANDQTRATAVAALGLLGDPEPVRSITRLATDPGGAVSSDALSLALSLL